MSRGVGEALLEDQYGEGETRSSTLTKMKQKQYPDRTIYVVSMGVSFSVQKKENLSITATRVGSCSCSSAPGYMAELRVVERRCLKQQ